MLKFDTKKYVLEVLIDRKKELDEDLLWAQKSCIRWINIAYDNKMEYPVGCTDDNGLKCSAKTILDRFVSEGRVTGKIAEWESFRDNYFPDYLYKLRRVEKISEVINEVEWEQTEEISNQKEKSNSSKGRRM